MNLAKLTNSLTEHEGSRKEPYRDSRGLWTFGIGRCLETNPPTAAEWKWMLELGAIKVTLSDVGEQYLFGNDIRAATTQIKARCDFWDRLDDVRQNVLVEMCFQMGIARLLAFNKMFAALRAGDYERAAGEAINSEWHRQTPERAEKLAEALRTGGWPQ